MSLGGAKWRISYEFRAADMSGQSGARCSANARTRAGRGSRGAPGAPAQAILAERIERPAQGLSFGSPDPDADASSIRSTGQQCMVGPDTSSASKGVRQTNLDSRECAAEDDGIAPSPLAF